MESIIAMLAATFGTFFFAIITFAITISSLISLGLFTLWIITLIDCIQRDEKDFAVGGSNAKLLWILLLVLVSNIVPIIYYFLIMYKKPRTGSKKSDNALKSKK